MKEHQKKNGSSEKTRLIEKIVFADSPGKNPETDQASTKLSAFSVLLNRITGAVLPEQNDEIKPNPEIIKTLRTSFRQSKRTGRQGFRENLADLLQLRVPIYKAGLVAIFLFVTIFALNDRSNLGESGELATMTSYSTEQSLLDSLKIVQQWGLFKDQKIGINMKEDSILIRFIVTSVEMF